MKAAERQAPIARASEQAPTGLSVTSEADMAGLAVELGVQVRLVLRRYPAAYPADSRRRSHRGLRAAHAAPRHSSVGWMP